MVQMRYIVNDIEAAIEFYIRQLGFHLDMHPAPVFAMLSYGNLRLVLSVPNPTGGGEGSPCRMEGSRNRVFGTASLSR
jgi:catechol 2,3-dioxygenase-like lactoylglutathione lyase family enzyme